MNRLMTKKEATKEIVEPFFAAVKKDLKVNPLKPGEMREYPNPFGRDMMPLKIWMPCATQRKKRRGK